MHLKHILPAFLAASISAQTIIEALTSKNDTLSTLIGLLGTQPALVSSLGSATNITLLAPSNAALAKFLSSTAGTSAATKPDIVTALLTYHVLNGVFPSTAFTSVPAFAPTLLKNTSYTNVTGGQRVKGVLTGGNVVLFSGLRSNSTVVTADIKFTGGVIHIIDTVLTIPQSDSATAVAAGLSSLAGSLTNSGLVSTVDGLKDVTIFAPSNDAFAGIASATANLTIAQLTSILTYHVVQGIVGYSSSLSNSTIRTVGGGNVTITVVGGNVFVNSAKVIVTDVLVSNGVVHVIDNVLNPGNTAATPNPTASTQSVAFSGASSTAKGTGTSTALTAGAPTGAVGMGALLGGAFMMMANM